MTDGKELTPSSGVFPDFPPENIILGEAAQTIVSYLNQHGPVRGAYKIDRNGDNAPVPTPSMPGMIHLALTQVASHPAMPYGGNVTALVRDLIYLGLGAMTHVLSNYDPEDKGIQFSAHVIRREETFRRDVLISIIGLNHASDMAGVAQTLKLSMDSGDAPTVLSILQRVFHNLEQLPRSVFRYQNLRLMYGTPEIIDAVVWLGEHSKHKHDLEVVLWGQQLGSIAEQVQEERKSQV